MEAPGTRTHVHHIRCKAILFARQNPSGLEILKLLRLENYKHQKKMTLICKSTLTGNWTGCFTRKSMPVQIALALPVSHKFVREIPLQSSQVSMRSSRAWKRNANSVRACRLAFINSVILTIKSRRLYSPYRFPSPIARRYVQQVAPACLVSCSIHPPDN